MAGVYGIIFLLGTVFHRVDTRAGDRDRRPTKVGLGAAVPAVVTAVLCRQ